MAKKRGRPVEFKPEHIEIAKEAARKGATNHQIAEACGVSSPQTLYNWDKRFNGFLDAVKEGKKEANDRVRAALFERAIGSVVKETKVFIQDGQVITEEIEKHFPPDTAAAKFWLLNREPDQWRDKSEVEHSGGVELASKIAEARKRISSGDES